jgi:hypothetical protein
LSVAALLRELPLGAAIQGSQFRPYCSLNRRPLPREGPSRTNRARVDTVIALRDRPSRRNLRLVCRFFVVLGWQYTNTPWIGKRPVHNHYLWGTARSGVGERRPSAGRRRSLAGDRGRLPSQCSENEREARSRLKLSLLVDRGQRGAGPGFAGRTRPTAPMGRGPR